MNIFKGKNPTVKNRIQATYDEIAILLGDKQGLIDEFTEIYRMVHGTVKNNTHAFPC